jgi:hypothetical protein
MRNGVNAGMSLLVAQKAGNLLGGWEIISSSTWTLRHEIIWKVYLET